VTDFGKETTEKVLNEVEAINYKTLAYKGTQRAFENFHSIYW
jgi:hypothetical protein